MWIPRFEKNWRRAWRCFLSGKRLENDFILMIEKKKKSVALHLSSQKLVEKRTQEHF